jgi:hypothetical protein
MLDFTFRIFLQAPDDFQDFVADFAAPLKLALWNRPEFLGPSLAPPR